MVTLTIIILLCAVLSLVLRSSLSTMHIVVLPAVPIALGAWLLVGEERARVGTALQISVSLVCIVAGYYGVRAVVRPVPRSQPGSKGARGDGHAYVSAMVGVAVLFTVVHFAIGGIPLLSGDIETRRFEFGSGLFGIPGRMYLFGLPLAVGAALTRAHRAGVPWHRDRLVLLAVVVLVGSRAVSGFKGGLIEALIIVATAAILARGPITSVARVLRRYLAVALLALVAVFLVGSLYSSYRATHRSLPNAIWSRATTNAAFPGVLVIERRLTSLPTSSVTLDARYFGYKYFKLGPGAPYSFGRVVAASIFHIGPETGAYVPPVTYGAFAETSYDFGTIAALAAMLMIGAALACCEGQASSVTLSGNVVRLAAVLAIYDWVNKGGMVYMLTNWGLMTAVMVLAGRWVPIALARRRRVASLRRAYDMHSG